MELNKLASEIRDMSEALLEKVSGADDLSELIELIDDLDTANRNIRFASTSCKAVANKKMDEMGEQRVVLPNGLIAEKAGSYRRTNIDREGLEKYVLKCARLEDIRIDPETGELRSPDVVALELHKRCFRSEPKWTELKNLGVKDDDFCSREFVPSVKLVKASSL